MSGLLLTREERERFAAWLENEANTSKILIEQIKKMAHGDVLSKREQMWAAATSFVAQRLRSTESYEVDAPLDSCTAEKTTKP